MQEAPQCAGGCQYAKDIGMYQHSCAGKCLYLDHPDNKEVPMSDAVKQPSHYASGGIECIEAIKASMTPEAFKGYLKGNVQKYLWRYEKKIAPAEDLAKAQVYLGWLIAEVE
ncbi:nucelotide kinase [Erwinia phage Micant]|uniref:Nucelotide kinase n=1 Tax=Erwinia phage Micant TaxID=2923255 RepID=A0AAE9FMZ3_9CAUD|nr:nucelotide kinase [Erwinia phage Micant]